MDTSHLLPAARALYVVDAVMAAWVAVWIGLGVAIGIDAHHLTALGHTVALEGGTEQAVGRSLGSLQGIPFVGGSIAHAAHQVEQAGASAVVSGQSSASSVRTLSWLLAVAVALLPSVPVLGFYLPLRLHRSRQTRALRRALRDHGEDPGFQAFLAQRAIVSLGYGRLTGLANAWQDVASGRSDRLAAAELRRLGIGPGAAARGRTGAARGR